MRKTLFADVLLPLPLPGYYTYRIPFEWNDLIRPGQRVGVQFGKKKLYSALVRRIHDRAPQGHIPKYILSPIDAKPIVNEIQFGFWEWLASYYMCAPGEVMAAALPSGLKLASETQVELDPDFDGNIENLNEKEILVIEALGHRDKLTLSEITRIVDQQKVLPLIQGLIEKQVIVTAELIEDKYRPRKETFVSLNPDLAADEQKMRELFDELGKKAYRQLQLLMSYLNLSRNMLEDGREVTRPDLLKSIDANSSVLNALVKKDVFRLYEKEVSRMHYPEAERSPADIELSAHQLEAEEQIRESLEKKIPVLLHGITSSGKTEIYIRMIDQTIRQGKQVLYLLPEIALTSQMISRLRRYFGNKTGVYHSRYNEQERVETWKRVLGTEPESSGLEACPVVLGARSAVFLPFERLGLIIIDEEHDSSYKQFDPAPRYNARDAAIYLADLHGAGVILGTATPSLESYHNATTGKYATVSLTERFGGLQLPEILVSDIREETRSKQMTSHFTPLLLSLIKEAMNNQEQVILFQNRRGFSPRLECTTCNHIPMCRNCDISLTYHKNQNRLICHYCGFSHEPPNTCPDCGSTRILMRGFGTQKVEEELKVLFPGKKVYRMDLDTTRVKNAHQYIIESFEKREIDILVGTQMVTKGLDFDHVSLVGIMNADNMLNFPDFRSYERSFQMMSQVAGRAGRKGKRGKVVIQTWNPKHPVIHYVTGNDIHAFYKSQLSERMRFRYPPFYRLIIISLKHREPATLNPASAELAGMLRDKPGKKVLGPEYPLVARIRGLYIKQILVKLERKASLHEIKKEIWDVIEEFRTVKEFRQVRVIIDVDPS